MKQILIIISNEKYMSVTIDAYIPMVGPVVLAVFLKHVIFSPMAGVEGRTGASIKEAETHPARFLKVVFLFFVRRDSINSNPNS